MSKIAVYTFIRIMFTTAVYKIDSEKLLRKYIVLRFH